MDNTTDNPMDVGAQQPPSASTSQHTRSAAAPHRGVTDTNIDAAPPHRDGIDNDMDVVDTPHRGVTDNDTDAAPPHRDGIDNDTDNDGADGSAMYVVPGSLGAIVRSYKAAVARRANRRRQTPGAPVWQRNYYERILRDDAACETIRCYIEENPLRWAEGHDDLDGMPAGMNARE